MKPHVEKEWRRVLGRLRRNGVIETSDHVSRLIRTKDYPLYLSQKFCERLLKRGEYNAAGRVLKAIKQSGGVHPLVDELYSSWLWCRGRRKAAISFARKSAEHWQRPYLFNQVGALYHLMAKSKGSAYYRNKADHYWHLAASMAESEESKTQPSHRFENKVLD